MSFSNMRSKFIVFCMMAMLLATFACGGGGSDSESTSAQGGDFNKFFPKSYDGFKVVFTQEKAGMAQAKLKKDDRDVAMLTIADLRGNPGAADKFRNSTAKIAGYPAASSGGQGTVVLVGDRFQVQVRSIEAGFTENDRKAWLEQFNLNGLSGLN